MSNLPKRNSVDSSTVFIPERTDLTPSEVDEGEDLENVYLRRQAHVKLFAKMALLYILLGLAIGLTHRTYKRNSASNASTEVVTIGTPSTATTLVPTVAPHHSTGGPTVSTESPVSMENRINEFPGELTHTISSPTLYPVSSSSNTTAVDFVNKGTEEPTQEPTEEPTIKPTEEPTEELTENPTREPTEEPTAEPSPKPTRRPTRDPTLEPTSLYSEPLDLPILINAGGSEKYKDTDGNEWLPDTRFTTTGRQRDVRNCRSTISGNAIDKVLYCSTRRNVREFQIPVEDGIYAVTLHFYNDEAHEYDIMIEGTRNYQVRGNKLNEPVVANMFAVVDDGFLSIALKVRTGSPNVSAIEVHSSTLADALAPPTYVPGKLTEQEKSLPVATYIPGKLTVQENGLILSEGLTAEIIAESGRRLTYSNGDRSKKGFHVAPDAGATFKDTRAENKDGWIYVSNSEAKPSREKDGDQTPGGVGAITFDKNGRIVDYKMVLENTRMNCGGGITPWGSWISGEEHKLGKIWQVDPTGEREAERITMGEENSGMFESFAYDTRDKSKPYFFMTVDEDWGALRRFSPKDPDFTDPWNILTGNGTIEYLVITPSNNRTRQGTYKWTTDYVEAAKNAEKYFPHSEGIDVVGNKLMFITKAFKKMFTLNLDKRSYSSSSTQRGLLDGQPDQVRTLIGDGSRDDILYFTEDGGTYAGIHGRDSTGRFYTILESHEYMDETSGLAFSPDGKRMLVAYQENGLLFSISRKDGLPFYSKTLDVKYHSTEVDR